MHKTFHFKNNILKTNVDYDYYTCRNDMYFTFITNHGMK